MQIISMEASFLIAKSTELFLDRVVEKMFQDVGSKDVVSYNDLGMLV